MEVKIEKKSKFTLAGVQIAADQTSEFPKVWGSLFEKTPHEELAKFGNGKSFGVCSEVKGGKTFIYTAAYDCCDEQQAAALGLTVMHIPEAEYAVVRLHGAVPGCIHQGWKYVMETFFPEQGYCHAGTPDFEAYSEGDMYSPDYRMELWVPIVKA